ncbi:MAG: single-stranded-DNA-specific exonuclease RecJ [Actinomycetes bacterium]|nr:single-stranded-DNA-specific exonuclease RecJ [Actinomycetes bacterium]
MQTEDRTHTAAIERFQDELGVSQAFARLLAARGFDSPDAVRAFQQPSLERDWLDPALVPGMCDAADRVEQAVAAGQHICVFGDFDCDGVTATAVVVRGLRALIEHTGSGARVGWLLPDRMRDGYGLSDSTVQRLIATGCDLVVTVDNGVSAVAEIAALRTAGVDVVVTDHHEPGDVLPADVAITNPKLDGAYGRVPDLPGHVLPGELAGAGVALKLIQMLTEHAGIGQVWRDLVDIACLGTIGDVMDLVAENRALVQAGLEHMRRGVRPGLVALAERTGRVDIATVDAEQVAFILSPRINAAGRVGSADVALELLLADDAESADALAGRLISLNEYRKSVERELDEAAAALAERTWTGERALILAGEGWHDGVRGIVASRIAERFGVVAVICTLRDGMAVCSGRSVGQVDLYRALTECADLFHHFGGHAGATGLTLDAARLDELRDRLNAHLDALPPEQFVQRSAWDLTVQLSDVDWQLAAEIESLQPFGPGNTRPVWCAEGVQVTAAALVGKQRPEHLRAIFTQDTARVKGIWFRAADPAGWIGHDTPADVVFTLEKDEFRGRRDVQLMVKDIRKLGDPFLRELFEHAPETVLRREYENIADADSFYTKLVGVTFEGRQELLAQLQPDEALTVQRQPDNPHDANAIAICRATDGAQLGFLNRDMAAELAAVMDDGVIYHACVSEVTGGEDGRARGLNILVTRGDSTDTTRELQHTREAARTRLTRLEPEQLADELRRTFIGDATLHPAQRESLDALARGQNTLTVMATGRGKSLIFHLHAARTALLQHRASLFVYPLRALVSDQFFHLQESFAELGLTVSVVTGESSPAQRSEAYEQLSCGTLDIVLTTPEYLYFHADDFARTGRIGFVVVDEAHHIGQARAGNRPAYARLGDAIAQLGGGAYVPTTLAVTATAGTDVAARIRETLRIDQIVLDPTVRENLHLVDLRRGVPRRRGRADEGGAGGAGGAGTGTAPGQADTSKRAKQEYLLQLAEDVCRRGGKKIVVYVNSRKESVHLARILRKQLPKLAWKVAYYNGGLDRERRGEVERRFREGRILCVIATSAFGEGVNIPDIRDIVLYHFPFNDVEFNQMAGRGGRDGQPSRVHLLFNSDDARINRLILEQQAPPRVALAAVWQVLRQLQRTDAGETGEAGAIRASNADIAEQANRLQEHQGVLSRECAADARGMQLTEGAVSAAVGIFRELGLVATRGMSKARTITLNADAPRTDLGRSVRYLEGIDENESFDRFHQWAFTTDADTLLARFNRPILPE